MKTFKKMLTVAMLLTMMLSYANEIKTATFKNSITIVQFSNVRKGHEFVIKDDRGTVLHRETIDKNCTYSQKFDLSKLKDGLYTVETIKDFVIIVSPFKIESSKVTFLEQMETKIFKPVVRRDNHQLFISQLTFDTEPLKIELFYNDNLIHTDTLKGEAILKRVYALSKNEKGDYFVRMTSGDRQFIERFSI
ncbi:MAG: hypothetical protein GYB32_01200 [Algicola sp.]|nr:hypothetical protein [Algicola sp.]